jgi:hypothetical protein
MSKPRPPLSVEMQIAGEQSPRHASAEGVIVAASSTAAGEDCTGRHSAGLSGEGLGARWQATRGAVPPTLSPAHRAVIGQHPPQHPLIGLTAGTDRDNVWMTADSICWDLMRGQIHPQDGKSRSAGHSICTSSVQALETEHVKGGRLLAQPNEAEGVGVGGRGPAQTVSAATGGR